MECSLLIPGHLRGSFTFTDSTIKWNSDLHDHQSTQFRTHSNNIKLRLDLLLENKVLQFSNLQPSVVITELDESQDGGVLVLGKVISTGKLSQTHAGKIQMCSQLKDVDYGRNKEFISDGKGTATNHQCEGSDH